MFPVAFHTNYIFELPENHRFPIEKYDLLPQQLLRNGIVTSTDFFQPQPVQLDIVKKVHCPAYVNRFVNNELTYHEGRRIGFIQTPQLVERELTLIQGTIDGAVKAMHNQSVAFNIAGGTHHACYAHGEGFCMLNDQAIAAFFLLDQTAINKVLIIDLDVHQGNGSANVCKQESRIFTYSIHGQHNYPFKKEQSSLDIGLQDGIEDAVYLAILKDTLPEVITSFQPDFIFYQAGVDILGSDQMGKFNCSLEGCRQRDAFVFLLAKQYNIPLQVSMGGGYSKKLATILDAHCNTYAVAAAIFS